MKMIQKVVLLVTMILFFVTCSENDPGIVTPEPDGGTPTEIGLPVGIPTIQIIGASGGDVVSADGLISIEVPAGALTSDTPIIIQPITNFAPNGNGNAYQLSPEGLTFAKPVRLIFKSPTKISATLPVLTEIAFQGEDKVWYSTENITWDDAKGTLATETMHFSRWTTYDQLQIINADGKAFKVKNGKIINGLNINEHAEFKLLSVTKTKLRKGPDDELTALSKTQVAVEFVDYWMINGDKNGIDIADQPSRYGKITVSGTDLACTYTAPERVPKRNPVDLSVHLKNVKYKDRRTGEIFDDLDVSCQIQIIGFYDFDVEFLYHNPLVFGGAGDFTGYDTATLKIHIDENDIVTTTKEIVNLNGRISPDFLKQYNCTTRWIAVPNVFPDITVSKVDGLVLTVGNGTTSQNSLVLSFFGAIRVPEFKAKCDGSDKDITVSEAAFQSNASFGTAVFMLRDSAQSVESDNKIFTATLHPFN